MSEDLMSIREMSEAFGVTPRALRFYESCDLLAPLRRGQVRLYSKSDRARLKLILRGKRFGFSLDQIREILELYNPAEKNLSQTEAALTTARERLADMKQQYHELGFAITELEEQIEEGQAALLKLQTLAAAGSSEDK